MTERIRKNSELSRAELAAHKTVLQSRPQVVFVELSRRCNLSCWMCHRFQLPKATFQDMTDELIDCILSQLAPFAQVVDLHGLGESTLHPSFDSVVERIHALGPRVRVVTNLNQVSDRTLEVLVSVDAMICFSLGATNQESYKKVWARGDFSRVCDRLARLADLRRSSRTCQDMRAMMMVYEPNLSAICDVMKLVRDYDVLRMHMWPMYLPNPQDPRYIGKHMGRWIDEVNRAFDLADQLGMELRVVDWPMRPSNSNKTLENFTCHRPWTHIMINYDGKIGLCDYNEHVPLLSPLYLERLPFEKIWNSDEYVKIREHFAANTPSEACRFCGDVCRKTKYVDFDDDILPELGSRILSNYSRTL